MYAKWHFLREQLLTAEARVDALDTWRNWATGKPVHEQDLTRAVETLHEIAAGHPDNGTRELADITLEWAERRGNHSQARIEHRRSISTGIEIDL